MDELVPFKLRLENQHCPYYKADELYYKKASHMTPRHSARLTCLLLLLSGSAVADCNAECIRHPFGFSEAAHVEKGIVNCSLSQLRDAIAENHGDGGRLSHVPNLTMTFQALSKGTSPERGSSIPLSHVLKNEKFSNVLQQRSLPDHSFGQRFNSCWDSALFDRGLLICGSQPDGEKHDWPFVGHLSWKHPHLVIHYPLIHHHDPQDPHDPHCAPLPSTLLLLITGAPVGLAVRRKVTNLC
jgi:hypothetical protein